MTETPAGKPLSKPRIATAGAHGYGRVHVQQVSELAARGRAEFVALADRVPANPGQLPDGVVEFTDLADLLAAVDVDVVTIATPIPTHLPLAELALKAGADVYLEKPPVTSLKQFRRLEALAEAAGKSVQVGFQSLGSAGIADVQSIIASGELGELKGLGGVGMWVRTLDYWNRAAWSGKRVLNGVPVIDGVVTNPFAHVTATALRIAGADALEDLAEITADLFHANDIEADDSSVVKIITSSGLPITIALTLCAAENNLPYVEVVFSEGRVVYFYTVDKAEIWRAGAAEPEHRSYERQSLLENLLDHRDNGAELLSPLHSTGGFMAVMEAVANHPGPVAIDDKHFTLVTDELGQHIELTDIADWIAQAIREHKTFTELGAPFTR